MKKITKSGSRYFDLSCDQSWLQEASKEFKRINEGLISKAMQSTLVRSKLSRRSLRNQMPHTNQLAAKTPSNQGTNHLKVPEVWQKEMNKNFENHWKTTRNGTICTQTPRRTKMAATSRSAPTWSSVSLWNGGFSKCRARLGRTTWRLRTMTQSERYKMVYKSYGMVWYGIGV